MKSLSLTRVEIKEKHNIDDVLELGIYKIGNELLELTSVSFMNDDITYEFKRKVGYPSKKNSEFVKELKKLVF